MTKAVMLYTVRNLSGQLIGRYRANSSKSAIQAARDEQAQYASFFKGQIARGMDQLTAKVEESTS